jgi:UDP-N-acetylmuramyl pentapeptide synthase
LILLPLAQIPYLGGDLTPDRLKAVLAAVAAAWALGIALHVIRTGAETFSNEPDNAIPSNMGV